MTKEGHWNNVVGRQSHINHEKPIFSNDVTLKWAFKEYKNNPLEHSAYWKKHWRILGREENLSIFVPDLKIGTKKLQEWESKALKPVYVPSELTGPEGVNILRSMYRRKMEITPFHKIENQNTESGWTLIPIKNNFTKEQLKWLSPDLKIENRDLVTHIISAGIIKDFTEHFPDEYNLNNNINTSSLLAGSFVDKNLSLNPHKNPDVPSAYFTQPGTLYITRHNPLDRNPNIIPAYQMPIKPHKVA